jgi:hypothetical protein
MVHIGLTAKRSNTPLKIFKRNGQPFVLHPTYLTFKVLPSGTIHTEFAPFRQGVDNDYVLRISALINQHRYALLPLLSAAHISHKTYDNYLEVLPLNEVIVPEEIGTNGLRFVSPKYYFPVNLGRGLYELILAFTLLYALLDSFVCIGEGQASKLEDMLEQFKDWYVDVNNAENNIEEREEENLDSPEIPELDSYSFIRAGKWWTVLARDKWKCLSCGRSAREDGVLLEVDHIIPRSKGGSDEMSNLQTLCKKCNLGKSNRDSTRL